MMDLTGSLADAPTEPTDFGHRRSRSLINNFADGITAVELLWLDGDGDEQRSGQ
jgi:hypothetical protein